MSETAAVRVTVLAGGIGAARFLVGLRTLAHDVTVIGNTGDDVTMWGLRICPDLDTVMYTLGGGISAERGWGRADETFRGRDELTAYAAQLGEIGPTWFGLGDLDLATHLLRTEWLAAGVPLSEVTRRLCERWQPGVRLLPMTDVPVETHVELTGGERLHFQEWWVRHQAARPARRIESVGAADAAPAPGVIDAIRTADVVLLPPSNPVVSIGAILAVPAIAEAVRTTEAPVVGVAPIIGGAPVRGMADACLDAIGVETSALAVARHYGRRPAGFLDGWLVDDVDKAAVDELEELGIRTVARPLLMTDATTTADIAADALRLAAEVA
jgi:LPPG:FO 2-phospho-L-lactate transferase